MSSTEVKVKEVGMGRFGECHQNVYEETGLLLNYMKI